MTKFDRVISSVSKEEFTEYYFSHPRKETMLHFNIGSTVFDRVRDFYNIKKPKELINSVRESTNLKKYGVENQFQRVDYIKQCYEQINGSLENHYKKCAESQAKSVIAKYGFAGGAALQGANSRKERCLEKYNCDFYIESDEFKEKAKITKLKRYGNAGYHNIEKMRSTNAFKYGVEYNFASNDDKINGRGTYHRMLKNEDYKSAINAKRESTCKMRYGEDYYIDKIKKLINSVSSKANSTVNNQFASFLLSYGIPFEREFQIGKYVYDFKLGKYLIEVDPYATHNSTWGIFNNPKPETYHRDKTINALNSGFICLHVFEWTDVVGMLYNIINKYINIVDTGKPRKYIFDYKAKCIVEQESENTVVIYDDGFEVQYINGNKD